MPTKMQLSCANSSAFPDQHNLGTRSTLTWYPAGHLVAEEEILFEKIEDDNSGNPGNPETKGQV